MSLAQSDSHSRHRAAGPHDRCSVRVGLYQRCPTAGESDRLRSYVASQPGWRIHLWSTDDASGCTLKRRGLQQMLEAVRSGAIDVLVINQVYNLSRTTRHLAFLFNELMSRGVRVVSAADPSFDTETLIGGLLVRSLFAFAEIEQVGALEDLRVRRHLRRHSAEVPSLSDQP